MSLNIENEETHRRVRELARLTGETTTQAVDRAVAERLTRARNRTRRVDKLLQIGRECAALPVLDARSPEDRLYDDRGLPRSFTTLTTAGISPGLLR